MSEHRRVTMSYDVDMNLQGGGFGDATAAQSQGGKIKKRGRDDEDEAVVDDTGALASPRPPPGTSGDSGSRGRGGGGGGGGGAPRQKKPPNMIEHVDPPMPEAVQMAKQLLTRLGDYSVMTDEDDVVGNIKALANVMVSVGDIANENADSIADLTLQCLTKLSVQVPTISTLIALIYKENGSFPRLILDKLSLSLISSLGEDDVPTSKMTLRALACLCSCGTLSVDGTGGFADTINSFLAIVEQSTSTTAFNLTPAAEVALYLVASTLPWCAEAFSKSAQGQAILARAVSLCERFCIERESPFSVGSKQAIFHIFSPRTVEDDAGVERETIPLTALPAGYQGVCVDTFWEACSRCASICVGAPLPPCMISPWNSLKEELESGGLSPMSLDDGTAGAVLLMHTQGRIGRKERGCLPQGNSIGAASSVWLQPRCAILDDTTHPDVFLLTQRKSPLERSQAVGYYQDIMHFFKPFLRENGTVVGSMDLLVKHLVAVGKLFPDGLCLEYILVEFLFQQLLANPSNPSHTSSICRLLLELCKKYPAIVPAIALCCHELFQSMGEMDYSSIGELASWLAFHLSNTQFVWPYWEDWWKDIVEGQPGDPRAMFLQTVVIKCGRIDVPERMRESLPDYLHPLIPLPFLPQCSFIPDELVSAQVHGAATGTFRALMDICQELIAMIGSKEKQSVESVEEWLGSLEVAVVSSPPSVCDKYWRVCVLLQCIFSVGRTTLSNLTSLMERYSEAIRSFCAGDDGQRAVCECVWEAWGGDQATLNIILDAMLRRGLLEVGALGSFLSSSTLLSGISTHPHLFLHITVTAERGLDIVRASVAHYREVFDTTNPSSSSSSSAIATDSTFSNSEHLSRGDPRVDGETMDEDAREAWSSSSIAEPSAIGDAAIGDDDDDNPVETAKEAMNEALNNARVFYEHIMGKFFVL